MRRFAGKLWDSFNKGSTRQRPTRTREPVRTRLEVERLEDRWVPTAPTPQLANAVSGIVFVDHNGTGVFGPGDATIDGVTVTLSCPNTYINAGKSINVTTVTDQNGRFTFTNVPQGTYQISFGPVTGYLQGGASLGNISEPNGVNIINLGLVSAGPGSSSNNIGLKGLDPNFINWSLFLSTSTSASFDFGSAGSGTAAASVPFRTSTIAPVALSTTTSPDVIELASNFSAPDITDSMVQLQTNFGNINLQLFDTLAPQTVTNYLDYINSGSYNNAIFHRLTTVANTGFVVLQGGTFTVPTSNTQTALPTIPTSPPIDNEVNLPNTPGTISMALTSSPNSATDGFFFNITNNTNSLSPQAQPGNGGFTVFGKIADAASQQVLNALVAVPTSSVTSTDSTQTFPNIPLQSGTNVTAFPTNTTAANYEVINKAVVLSQNEKLTYSVTNSDTAGTIVTASVAHDQLTLTRVGPGTATITVTATDQYGSTAQTTFTVTVT